MLEPIAATRTARAAGVYPLIAGDELAMDERGQPAAADAGAVT